MAHRPRIKYSLAQKADIWDRWQRGESMCSIGRVFDRYSTSTFGQERTLSRNIKGPLNGGTSNLIRVLKLGYFPSLTKSN